MVGSKKKGVEASDTNNLIHILLSLLQTFKKNGDDLGGGALALIPWNDFRENVGLAQRQAPPLFSSQV